MKKRTRKCELCLDEISLSNFDKHLKVCNGSGKQKVLANCQYCAFDLSTLNGGKFVGAHIRWCNKNPNKTGNINGIDWTEIQTVYNNGISLNGLQKMFNLSRNQLNSAFKSDLLNKISHNFHHTDETKKIISEKRKKFLSENPDKHVWKRNDKFKSVPCEYFKGILRENFINYTEEYSPLDSDNFSLDIAFPDKRIAIEVNGNQHYNKDKTLKEYYQNRENVFKENGWNMFQIHYSLVYKEEFVSKFIKQLKSNFNLGLIDYSFYLKKEKQLRLCNCGAEIKTANAEKCTKCSSMQNRKIERPSLLQLNLDISNMGYSATGRKYNVSDNSIRQWIKNYKKND
jgi:hypothetical protein